MGRHATTLDPEQQHAVAERINALLVELAYQRAGSAQEIATIAVRVAAITLRNLDGAHAAAKKLREISEEVAREEVDGDEATRLEFG